MAENLSTENTGEKSVVDLQKDSQISSDKEKNQEDSTEKTPRKRKKEIIDAFAESAKKTKMDDVSPEILLKCTIQDLIRSSRSSSGWVIENGMVSSLNSDSCSYFNLISDISEETPLKVLLDRSKMDKKAWIIYNGYIQIRLLENGDRAEKQ